MPLSLRVKKSAGCGYKTYACLSKNNTSEFYIAVEATGAKNKSLSSQLEALSANYLSALKASGLDTKAASYIALFTKSNRPDKEILSFLRFKDAPVSVIRQAPLSKAAFSLIAYCMKFPFENRNTLVSQRVNSGKHDYYLTRLKNYTYIWSLNLNDPLSPSSSDASLQTVHILRQLQGDLKDQKVILAKNLLRTWVYVNDLYSNYKQMTEARARLFNEENLNNKTHFVASTGIGGKIGTKTNTMVSMNALSVAGLKNNQVAYLRPENAMCPSYKYNVTFERGSKVSYGDRAHIFISGTASINKFGDLLFPGDILKQTNRTLSNIKAVLKSGKASLKELAFLIIYVKYPKHAGIVKKTIGSLLPDLPCVYLQAPICRKEWLVEIEGVAILKENNKRFLPF